MTKNLNTLRSSLLLALLLVTSMAKPIMWQLDEIDETPEITWPEEAVILPQLICASNEYLKQCDIQENTFLTLSPFKHRKTSTRPLNDISDAPQSNDGNPAETQELHSQEAINKQHTLRWHTDKHQVQLDWEIIERFQQSNDVNPEETQEWLWDERNNNQFELQWQSDEHQEQSDNQENTIIPLSPYKTRNLLISPLHDISNTPLHWHTDKHQELLDWEIPENFPQSNDFNHGETQELHWEESTENQFTLRWHTDKYQEQYDNHTKVEVIGLIWDDAHEIEIPATAARYSGVLKSIMNNPYTTDVDVEKLIFSTGNPCAEIVEAVAHSLAIIDHTLNDYRQVKKLFSEYVAQLPEEMQSRLKVAIHNLEIKSLIRYYEKNPEPKKHHLKGKIKCDCHDCLYSVKGKNLAEKHRISHAIEKRFRCYCGYRTNNKGHLTYHNRIHTGEKPFMCHLCGNGYSQKANLINHMGIHIDEKKFKCDRCNKYTTNDPSNFKRHQRGCFAKLTAPAVHFENISVDW